MKTQEPQVRIELTTARNNSFSEWRVSEVNRPPSEGKNPRERPESRAKSEKKWRQRGDRRSGVMWNPAAHARALPSGWWLFLRDLNKGSEEKK